jgi:predicted MPP superfamily phosphohydrolase
MRITEWAGEPYSIGWVGGVMLWAAGFAGMWYSFSGPKMAVRYLVVHWMGASFIFASVVLGYELVRLFTDFNDALAAPWLVILGSLLVIAAVLTSHHLAVKKTRIASPKIQQSKRVVQISDVHIGSRQRGFMQRVVSRINGLEPDFVVITGDLIDSASVEIESLQALEHINATTFFSVGNHERYADLPKAIGMLETLGVVPLRQSTHLTDDLQFIGIDDADHPEQVSLHLPDLGVSPDCFTILLYHRPMGWESAVEHGVDLMLSGHTHNGQIFPFNYLVRQQFARIKGLYQTENAYLYVNSGTGTWGPLMRLGTRNEISCFDLVPNPPEPGDHSEQQDHR